MKKRVRKERLRMKSAGKSYLVDHHDGQEVADGGKDQAIHVVRDALADRLAKGVDDDLAHDKEEDAKGNVAEGPSLLEGSDDEKNLHDGVDGEEDCVENVENDKETDGVVGAQAAPVLESQDADDKGDGEDGGRADSE